MTLTIDVGNSQITGGLFKDDNLVLQFRKTTNTDYSSDELGIFLRDVLRENNFDWHEISKIGCCSVVPALNHSLNDTFIKYFCLEGLFIQAGIKTGLKLKLSNPKEIGADLIAGALGAISLYPNENLIIVNMGTATTFELVTKDKEYLGGAILSGLKISMQALSNTTANLPAVEIARPSHICGSSTTEAIQAGLYYGLAGSIKELTYLYKKNIFSNQNALVIGTGGFINLYKDYKLFDKICPELVLLGIKKAIEINC